MEEKFLYTTCDCKEFEHTVRYGYQSAEEKHWDPYLWVEICINDYGSIWSRIKKAIQFVFKRKRYGLSVDSLIRREDISKIRQFLQESADNWDRWLIECASGQLLFKDLIEDKDIIKSINKVKDNTKISLSFFRQKLKFVKQWEVEAIENKRNLPFFIEAFINFKDINKRLPTQDEFWRFYASSNRKNKKFTEILVDKKLRRALYCRTIRAYPSFVRDFILYKQLLNKGCNVNYSINQDINGVDLVIINKNGVSFNIHCYVKPKVGNKDWRESKDYRHNFSGKHMDLKLNRYHCKKIGDLMYYRKDQIDSLLEKIENVKEGN